MTRGDCQSIRPMISAALDGELDENQFVRLSEHLASCAECRTTYQDYTQLRDELRTASTPAPPSHLERSIRKETVDKPPPPLFFRLASRAGLKFGVSTVAASLVILFALGIFGYVGYDQRTAPSVAGSQPGQESIENWPVNRPIEISFSKAMNKGSVEENLSIRPTSEVGDLPMSWDGNTLIIGRSETHSVLLIPETDYKVIIWEDAEDSHGNPLGQNWVLEFSTGPREVSMEPDSEGDEPEQDDSTLSDLEPDDDRVSAQESPEDDSSNDEDDGSDSGTSETGDSRDPSGGEEGDEAAVRTTEPEEPEQPDPTDVPDQQPTEAPTRTPEPADPTEEPEDTPEPSPTQEPDPEPTASPTNEPTEEPVETADDEEPDATGTPEPIAVKGAFGEVYWGNEEVEEALGRPTQSAISFIAAEQEFQRGLMFRAHFEGRNALYIFINDGKVRTEDYESGHEDFSGEDLGDGLYEPSGVFGKEWSESVDLQEALGHAVSRTPNESIEAAIQQFNRGQMIYSRGMVYVFYESGDWEVFADRSEDSGGYQGDDDDEEDKAPSDGDDQSDENTDPETGETSDEADENVGGEQTQSPDEESGDDASDDSEYQDAPEGNIDESSSGEEQETDPTDDEQ